MDITETVNEVHRGGKWFFSN